MTLTAGVWAPGRNFNEERRRVNNVLKGRWALPSSCLNKMMKSLMKAYLHVKIDELADSLEGQVAQSTHSCFLMLDCSEPVFGKVVKYEMGGWSSSNCPWFWLDVVSLSQWLHLYLDAHKHSPALILSPQNCWVNSFVGSQLDNRVGMQKTWGHPGPQGGVISHTRQIPPVTQLVGSRCSQYLLDTDDESANGVTPGRPGNDWDIGLGAGLTSMKLSFWWRQHNTHNACGTRLPNQKKQGHFRTSGYVGYGICWKCRMRGVGLRSCPISSRSMRMLRIS